jgi:CBS domain-containing protein
MSSALQMEPRTIREVMTPTPVTVPPDATLSTLKRLFEAHDFNAFPVVDGEGALRGMVTKLDFLKAFRPDRRRLIPDLRRVWADTVEDLMSRGLVSVGPDDPVGVAVDLMVGQNLRSLPVVESVQGRPVLVGIVSRGDVVRCLIPPEPDAG